jgi:hypothetical protein
MPDEYRAEGIIAELLSYSKPGQWVPAARPRCPYHFAGSPAGKQDLHVNEVFLYEAVTSAAAIQSALTN